MPLEKSASKKAFSHNVSEMMHSGHPQKQSLAAAYATKRRAMSKRRRMADGGQVAPKPSPTPDYSDEGGAFKKATLDPDKQKQAQSSMNKAFGFAEGGKVGVARSHDSEDSEMGKGQPGKMTPDPCPDCHEMHDSEMDCAPPGHTPRHEGPHNSEAYGRRYADSEMDHFAMGGMLTQKEFEEESMMREHAPPHGSIAEPMEEEELHDSMRSSEMDNPPGSTPRHQGPHDSEAFGRRYADSEMDHFAEGGRLKGNYKLQEAYKSVHEKVRDKHMRMADGGDVEIELNAMEEGEDSYGSAPSDKMARHAAQKENYDEGMHSAFGEDGQDEMHGESILDRIKRKHSRR